MSLKCLEIALTLILSASVPLVAGAQKHCLGTSYSYSGIGLYYGHDNGDGSFIDVSLRAETSEMFSGRTSTPGVSASFSWNFAIYTIGSRCGNKIIVFAGPGIAAGICRDYKTHTGVFFGLKGRAGVCCRYRRNLNISVCIAPIIGPHLTLKDEGMEMRYFKDGLLRAAMPEIGIGYRF